MCITIVEVHCTDEIDKLSTKFNIFLFKLSQNQLFRTVFGEMFGGS